MSNEIFRLNAVSRFMQPDAALKKNLDDIVTLTSQVCETTVALVTLIDENTQWFKASKGVDIDCTDRDLSFCNYTIQQHDLNVINDTLLDKRFASNPLVKAEPHVRFYAGVTMTT